MKYFIDFEFIEGFKKPLFGKRRHFIDMISVGIFCEDGRKFYEISSEYNYKDANDWVKDNVIIPMYVDVVHGDNRNRCNASNFHWSYGKSNKEIVRGIIEFIEYVPLSQTAIPAGVKSEIEFYGYYADYDWVLLCSLFGRMIDLPKGYPMYCIDLKQMLDERVVKLTNSDFFTHFHITEQMGLAEKLATIKKTNNKYPEQTNEHNALADAEWNYKLFEFIKTITKC